MERNDVLHPLRPPPLKHSLARAVLAGGCASVLSAMALVAAGRRQAGSAAAPLNAVSHWWWDREALRRQEADVRHTVLGYATHHVASTFWGAALAAFLHWRPQAATKSGVVAAGAATSALACLVDFKLTPRRLTPGFEHRLSSGALAATYIAFALGLAAGCLAAPAPRHRSTDTEA